MDPRDYGIDVGLLISGLFGAILLTSKDSAQNLGKTISSLVGGAASANYIAPIVITFTNLNDNHYHYGIAFLLGFLGLKGIEYFSSRILPDHVIPHSLSSKQHSSPVPTRRKRKKTTN